jgi:hypothetical protein
MPIPPEEGVGIPEQGNSSSLVRIGWNRCCFGDRSKLVGRFMGGLPIYNPTGGCARNQDNSELAAQQLRAAS